MLATIQRTVAAGVKHVRPMPFDGVGVRGVLDIALGDMRRQCVCVSVVGNEVVVGRVLAFQIHISQHESFLT